MHWEFEYLFYGGLQILLIFPKFIMPNGSKLVEIAKLVKIF